MTPVPNSNPQIPAPQHQFSEDDVKDPTQLALKLNKAFSDYAQIITQLMRGGTTPV